MTMRVLVTGASRGIGQELASLLRSRGHDVIATSRDGSAGAQLDVADAASIDALAASLKNTLANKPSLDALVNNAGIYTGSRAAIFATNFFGTLAVTDAIAPLVKAGGVVVNVSSGMGELSGASPSLQRTLRDDALTRADLVALVRAYVDDDTDGRGAGGWPTNAYSASKLALNALTRVLARELSNRGVRVNSVCPGWCRTDMGGAGAPRSVEQGALSVMSAALDATANAGFFRDGHAVPW